MSTVTDELEEREGQADMFAGLHTAQPRHAPQPSLHLPPRPPIVALLGGDNYAEAVHEAAKDRTLHHELVLMPTPSARVLGKDMTTETDRELMALEMARVGLANYVLVVAPDGYVSPLQAALISHASRLGRVVVWWNWGDRSVSLD